MLWAATETEARATVSTEIGPACRTALAPKLCAVHNAVRRTNLIRTRKGYERDRYGYGAEGHPGARLFYIWYWRTLVVRARALPMPWLGGSWYSAAMCVHSKEGAWNANTGNGYYGGLQFALSTWQSNGGSGWPYLASPAEQLRIGYRTWERAGWNPWPNTARACGLL